MIRVAISGFFDPLHLGHIIHMQKAKALGHHLIVIVNSDKQGLKKRGFNIIPEAERMAIIKNLRFVDEVVLAIDEDYRVSDTLRLIRPDIFAKGGDRTIDHMPEVEIEVCKEIGCELRTGIGEDPPYHSSSRIIQALLSQLMKSLQERLEV